MMTLGVQPSSFESFTANAAGILQGAGFRKQAAINQLKQKIVEEEANLRSSRPKVLLGCPGYGRATDGFWRGFLDGASDRVEIDVDMIKYGSSLLGQSFNNCWAPAVSHAAKGLATHFAMLHTDVDPARFWVDTLWELCEELDADIVSVVIPIKNHKGLTSTAISSEEMWEPERRLTMKEIMKLPETFSQKDTVDAGLNPDNRELLVNTGCWICDLRKPWVNQFDEAGKLKCFFTVQDQVRRLDNGDLQVAVIPEDWNFTRQVRAVSSEARIFCTRKVRVGHQGEMEYPNDAAWGGWEYDEETQEPPSAELPKEEAMTG